MPEKPHNAFSGRKHSAAHIFNREVPDEWWGKPAKYVWKGK